MGITEQSFLKDVAKHQLKVLRDDDGVYRHLQLSEPGTNNLRFDLVTYPGHLVYSGDMGTFVFERTNDMFQFFRRESKGPLQINLSYWSEKLEAVSGNRNGGAAKEFSEAKFHRAVLSDLIQWLRNHRDCTSREERRDLWDEVMRAVFGAENDLGGYRKQCAAHDFHHKVNESTKFYFQDFGEHDVTSYTRRFIWCCYAIVWGIRQYDAAKAATPVAA